MTMTRFHPTLALVLGLATPLAALPTLASDTRAPMATRPDYPQLAMSHPRAERIWLPSRGPPNQTEV